MNILQYVNNLIYHSKLNSSILVLFLLMCLYTIIFASYSEIKHISWKHSLQNKVELLNSLCSTVDDVFIIYDSIHHRFEYISPNFEKVLGFSRTKLYHNKNSLFDFVHPGKREEYIEQFTSTKLQEYKELVCEYCHPTSKLLQWLVIRFYPVTRNNKIYRYITCIHDGSKEYQAQEALKVALQSSTKANEAKKEYIYHLSHELKTPINSMLGITQLALASISDTHKIRHYLETLHYSANNMLDLTNNILDMAKIDSNKLILNKKPFSMLKTISMFSSLISSQAELKNVRYKLTFHPASHDYLVGDSLRILQIIGNCLSNSIKFTPSGGLITFEIREIEYTAEECLYRFQITDTGRGMDEAYINRIFEPFDQENQEIGIKYGGTGLGMSITKTLLELMGGVIHINSRLVEGTTVTIDIPLAIAAGPLCVTEANLSLPSVEYDFTGMCVLIVEDNEINLEIVTEYLHRVNVRVEAVTNGNSAIERFKASEEGYYDMILMDVHMPDISGYEVSRRIRSMKKPDADRIVIVTMTADNYNPHHSYGASDINYHLSKPIDPNKLYSLINATWLKKTNLPYS